MGQTQTLSIKRFSKNGAYLTPFTKIAHHPHNALDIQEVLLPQKFLPKDAKTDDHLQVFVYTDSDDRPVATTQIPKAELGTIIALEIISRTDSGCFLDMGLDKDLFMPTKSPQYFQISQKVVIKIALDKQSRLIAKQNIKDYLKPSKIPPHTKVEILVFEQTPLGMGCVVNQKYYGLLYHNELNTPLTLGSTLEAYVKKARPDGKLDLTLLAPYHQTHKQQLIDAMPLRLDFSSQPQEIFDRFHISKKTFKRLINELVKEEVIEFKQERDKHYFALKTHKRSNQ
ncbi:hypothetical protein LS68_007585 [Helicobacter sp. MIT 05-5293]|nr:hypothetical protein LS68_007585 [Helicobacter sp. MIT 05-5293]